MNANDLLKLHEQVVDSWNRHDSKKFVTYMDENIVLNDTSNPKPIKGKRDAEVYFNTWITAFPDFTMKPLNTVISGDYIAAEVECSGTNKGPLKIGDQPEFPATNKKVTNKVCFFAKVKNGKATEVRTYPDVAGMMVQLGLHEFHVEHA
jgi:predicted ester cyclase